MYEGYMGCRVFSLLNCQSYDAEMTHVHISYGCLMLLDNHFLKHVLWWLKQKDVHRLMNRCPLLLVVNFIQIFTAHLNSLCFLFFLKKDFILSNLLFLFMLSPFTCVRFGVSEMVELHRGSCDCETSLSWKENLSNVIIYNKFLDIF